MKSTFRLIRRFILILLVSVIGLIALNLILLVTFTSSGVSNAGGWNDTEKLSAELTKSKSGGYTLSEEGQKILGQRNAWAILIDGRTGDVAWHSDNLPQGVPLHYSASDISYYTRGYIEDYPTTTASHGDDLVIMGHPKDMYWKHMYPTFDYHIIVNSPKIALLVLVVNFAVVLLIYFISTSGVLRSVKPIVMGIEALPEGEDVYIRKTGLLTDLTAAINRASEKLRMQERALKKKEAARANWISGVSHDIRTPLSMVMGYAGQLEEDLSLSEENRKKAEIIRLQSVRMKNLVNDLNLSSKLEYNMQPMKREPVHLVTAARQAVVDFMNLDPAQKYPVDWNTAEPVSSCVIEGDKGLLLRAMQNLLTNAQVHNPDGCRIFVTVSDEAGQAQIMVEDNGVGVTEEQLEKLRNTPHYLMCDGITAEQRHGLGLLIVQQIVKAHGGTVAFDHGKSGGFCVTMRFPKELPKPLDSDVRSCSILK